MGEDLWSLGIHFKKTRRTKKTWRTLIQSLYKPSGGNISSTVAWIKKKKEREVKVLTFGPIRKQPIRN
jgi:hypothetical protein